MMVGMVMKVLGMVRQGVRNRYSSIPRVNFIDKPKASRAPRALPVFIFINRFNTTTRQPILWVVVIVIQGFIVLLVVLLLHSVNLAGFHFFGKVVIWLIVIKSTHHEAASLCKIMHVYCLARASGGGCVC